MIAVRSSSPADLDSLARLWHAGWHEAHAAIVPPALTRVRALASFRERLAELGDDLRTAGPAGFPLGLRATKQDELYQVYMTPGARGTGLAGALLADAEARLVRRGTVRAKLVCADGNDRAARFYECSGWTNMGLHHESVDTEDGPFAFDLLRFEKTLRAD